MVGWEELASPGSSWPDIEPRQRAEGDRCAAPPAAPSTASGDPRIDRATRNGPRISSSAVTAMVVKPGLLRASSRAASNRRVFPIPGSPSSVRPTVGPPGRGDLLLDRRQLRRAPTTSPEPRCMWSAIGENAWSTGASATASDGPPIGSITSRAPRLQMCPRRVVAEASIGSR